MIKEISDHINISACCCFHQCRSAIFIPIVNIRSTFKKKINNIYTTWRIMKSGQYQCSLSPLISRIDIRPMFNKCFNNIQMALYRCIHQCRITILIFGINICTVIKKKLDYLQVPMTCCRHECCVSQNLIFGIYISPLSNEGLYLINIPIA